MLIALLVAATVVFDVALFWGVSLDYLDYQLGLGGPRLDGVVFLALTISQANLLAIWVALGQTPLPWRLAGAALAIGFLGGLEPVFNYRNEGPAGVALVVAILLVHAVAVVAGSCILRLAGVILVSTTHPTGVEGQARRKSPFQFPLRRMFAWMTSTAVVLAVFRCMVDYAPPRDLPNWSSLLVASVADAALALTAAWAVLGTWHPALGMLTLGATTAAVIGVNYHWAELTPLFDCSVFVLLQVLWSLASLAVVRVAGYRLVWRPSRSATDAFDRSDNPIP